MTVTRTCLQRVCHVVTLRFIKTVRTYADWKGPTSLSDNTDVDWYVRYSSYTGLVRTVFIIILEYDAVRIRIRLNLTFLMVAGRHPLLEVAVHDGTRCFSLRCAPPCWSHLRQRQRPLRMCRTVATRTVAFFSMICRTVATRTVAFFSVATRTMPACHRTTRFHATAAASLSRTRAPTIRARIAQIHWTTRS